MIQSIVLSVLILLGLRMILRILQCLSILGLSLCVRAQHNSYERECRLLYIHECDADLSSPS